MSIILTLIAEFLTICQINQNLKRKSTKIKETTKFEEKSRHLFFRPDEKWPKFEVKSYFSMNLRDMISFWANKSV